MRAILPYLSGLILIAMATAVHSEVRVVDGDTLDIDGTIYRINGIDAPEHGQLCGTWACGAAATDSLIELTKGRDVTCTALSKDRYSRVIATCDVAGTDIGASMVNQGLAWAFLRYSTVYRAQEATARTAKIGIWSGVFAPPWEYRNTRWNRAVTREGEAPEDCPIKGNISQNGMIYHTPWSQAYGATKINTSKGERWFCSEAEALAAGWRAPYWH